MGCKKPGSDLSPDWCEAHQQSVWKCLEIMGGNNEEIEKKQDEENSKTVSAFCGLIVLVIIIAFTIPVVAKLWKWALL